MIQLELMLIKAYPIHYLFYVCYVFWINWRLHKSLILKRNQCIWEVQEVHCRDFIIYLHVKRNISIKAPSLFVIDVLNMNETNMLSIITGFYYLAVIRNQINLFWCLQSRVTKCTKEYLNKWFTGAIQTKIFWVEWYLENRTKIIEHSVLKRNQNHLTHNTLNRDSGSH